MRTVWFILRKEILQALRDRQLLPLIFLIPVMQLIMFGYVATTDIHDIRLYVVDHDRSAASRRLIGRFTDAGLFVPAGRGASDGDVVRALDRGRAQVALVIPPGYSRALAAGDTARVQIVVDGTDSNLGVQAQNYAARIVAAEADELVGERFERIRRLGIQVAAVDARTRVWYNPELASVNFMVPGLIGLLLSIVTVQLTSQAVVKEREAGTLEQLMVTPIARWQLILGKILPFVVLGFIDVIIISVVGVGWFGVPLRGSIGLLLALSAVFLFAILGQGLLVSAVSRNQQQASVTSQIITIPALLLSGFIFPISGMPEWMQMLTYAVPLRYYLVIVRGIFLKGAGLATLWDEVLWLAVLGVVIFAAAAGRFHKRLSD